MEKPTNYRFVDLEGRRFHRLLVIAFEGRKGPKLIWRCKCDCGRECIAHGYDLTHGKHKSCGCLHLEAITTHGHSAPAVRSLTYQTWTAMKGRCLNPRAQRYDRYGGRGIAVCDRWLLFENFLADMGERPSKRHSIDRYPNNDGNYEPGNCRWATKSQQNNNRSGNHLETLEGVTLTVTQWAARAGLDIELLRGRLKTGWDFDKAINTPPIDKRVRDAAGRWT